MPDKPFTVEVSYTEPVVKRKVLTVHASKADIAETLATDMVRSEDHKRFVLTAKAVKAEG